MIALRSMGFVICGASVDPVKRDTCLGGRDARRADRNSECDCQCHDGRGERVTQLAHNQDSSPLDAGAGSVERTACAPLLLPNTVMCALWMQTSTIERLHGAIVCL